ncbi:hypothetical protein PGH07_05160 [Sulfurovum sp. zt1-1]|uniref:Uncharacterized protein n=1 Tax=Sulfurovum zhangzhouensis TaxID=3019067 RepID=A0ABT7QXK2_9BACT|nr:hypothetical protein [Sulfurovum zhangzhouensis]MDM5271555.1 hypothetical protein [Sulfurovum zhangzhouensis]
MHTPLTKEQQELYAHKDTFIAQKAELLKEYKSYQKDLEFAENDFEKGLVLAKRGNLAVQIKALGQQIREIESWENQV